MHGLNKEIWLSQVSVTTKLHVEFIKIEEPIDILNSSDESEGKVVHVL